MEDWVSTTQPERLSGQCRKWREVLWSTGPDLGGWGEGGGAFLGSGIPPPPEMYVRFWVFFVVEGDEINVPMALSVFRDVFVVVVPAYFSLFLCVFYS